MATPLIKGDYNPVKARLLKQWPNLQESDLNRVEGQDEALVSRIIARTRATRDEVLRIINAEPPEQPEKGQPRDYRPGRDDT